MRDIALVTGVILWSVFLCGVRADETLLLVETVKPNLLRVREEGSADGAMNRYGILASFAPVSSNRVSLGTLELAGRNVLVEKRGKGYRIRFPLAADERVYGLGDVSRSNFQRRPGKYEIYVKNVNSYIPIPMFITSGGVGVFVNTTWRNEIDVGESDRNAVVCTAACSPIDFYVFTGADYRELLGVYTELTGRPALLPVFGYGFSYVANQWIDQFALLREAQEFRDRDFPCDVIGLEPGWMSQFYDFKTTKRWHPERFSIPYWCPKSGHTFLSALERMGFKLSLWLCCDYDLFRYEEELIGGRVVDDPVDQTVKKVDDGTFHDKHVESAGEGGFSDPRHETSHYPKKTVPEGREPWFEHLKFFVDQGVRCFKLDGSAQVVPWNGRPKRIWANGMNDEEAHNLYPLVYAKQMARGYEGHTGRRAMVYSVGGYAGVQQYVATWAGDTGGGPRSLVSCLNLAASGHSNQSCDMDIFTSDTRMVNAPGLHFGFLQAWSQQNNWDYWEQPWYQPREDADIVRNYIRLRYRLLPYLYGAAAEASRTGWPMMRPLAFVYPKFVRYANEASTFLLGNDLLVSCYSKTTEIPPGIWFDWWTGAAVNGPCTRTNALSRAVGGGLYVRAGAIIPLLPDGVQYVERGWASEIELHVWPQAHGCAEWYEDDGDSLAYRHGGYSLVPLELKDGVLFVGRRKGSFDGMPAVRHVRVIRHDEAEATQVACVTIGSDSVQVPVGVEKEQK